MPFSRLEPPLEYLHAASRASLQSFELTRLNHAANLRSEIGALIDQWLEETAEAMLARWMLEHGRGRIVFITSISAYAASLNRAGSDSSP